MSKKAYIKIVYPIVILLGLYLILTSRGCKMQLNDIINQNTPPEDFPKDMECTGGKCPNIYGMCINPGDAKWFECDGNIKRNGCHEFIQDCAVTDEICGYKHESSDTVSCFPPGQSDNPWMNCDTFEYYLDYNEQNGIYGWFCGNFQGRITQCFMDEEWTGQGWTIHYQQLSNYELRNIYCRKAY